MSLLDFIFPILSPYLVQTTAISNRTITNTSSDALINVDDLLKSDIENSKKVVIIGPDRADKTSLVFQAAVSAAALGLNVTYICTHPLKRLPCLVHGMATPEPATMNNVDFLYLETANELVAWLASLHMKTKLPSFIIIEDVLNYAIQLSEQNLERSLAKLCAMISDTTSWLASNNETKKCHIIVTAPTRVNSLHYPVFSQFQFHTLSYHGPEKSSPFSQLQYESANMSVHITFHRQKESLFVTEVQASKQSNDTASHIAIHC